MKVLLLGTGHALIKIMGGHYSRCHSCSSNEEYLKIIQEADQIIMLDSHLDMHPDVLATVMKEPWADKVIEAYGKNFDIIIDEITHLKMNRSRYYKDEAMRLLKLDGVFYGRTSSGETVKALKR